MCSIDRSWFRIFTVNLVGVVDIMGSPEYVLVVEGKARGMEGAWIVPTKDSGDVKKRSGK